MSAATEAAPNSAAAQARAPISASSPASSLPGSLARRIWNSVSWRFLIWTPLTIGVGVKFGVGLALCFSALVALVEGIVASRNTSPSFQPGQQIASQAAEPVQSEPPAREEPNPFWEILEAGGDPHKLLDKWINDPKTKADQAKLRHLKVAFDYAAGKNEHRSFAQKVLEHLPEAIPPHCCDEVFERLAIEIVAPDLTEILIRKRTAHFSEAKIRFVFNILKDTDPKLKAEFLRCFPYLKDKNPPEHSAAAPE